MSLSKAAKRVAIAKDVLAQIKANQLTAVSGVYVSANLDNSVKHGDDAQAVLAAGKVTHCEGCALGSALLSFVRLYDGVKFGGASPLGVNTGLGSSYIECERPTDVLAPLFGEKQLDLIETAFEGGGMTNLDNISRAEEKRAAKYYEKYEDDEERLVVIMLNIVRNKGTFKPAAR